MQKYELTKNDILSMIALTVSAILKDDDAEAIVEIAEYLYDDVTQYFVPKD